MKHKLYVLSSIIFLLIFLYSGLGVERKLTGLLALYSSIILLFSTIVYQKKQFKLPKHYYTYLLFLFIFFINIFQSSNFQVTSELFIVYLTGGFIWLISYNLIPKFKENVINILILSAYLYGILFIINFITGGLNDNSYSLFSAKFGSHNHLGDYWAILLLSYLPFLKINEKFDTEKSMGIITGITFIVLSFSRSSYIALLAGTLLFFQNNRKILSKRTLLFLTILLITLIIYTSSFKNLIFSRFAYFTESLTYFAQNPFGTLGVGNFESISHQELDINNFNYSRFTHNIILEFMVGMGLFSLVFIYWLANIISDFVKQKKDIVKNIYIILFLSLTLDFMFDYTYAISTFVWIWFLFLGMSQRHDVKNENK